MLSITNYLVYTGTLHYKTEGKEVNTMEQPYEKLIRETKEQYGEEDGLRYLKMAMLSSMLDRFLKKSAERDEREGKQ